MPRKFSNSDTIKNHNFLKRQSIYSGKKFIHPLVKKISFVNFITLFSSSFYRLPPQASFSRETTYFYSPALFLARPKLFKPKE